MQRADRQARLERAKAIGRIAYTHVRDAEIFGNIEIDGEEKQFRELTEGGIAIELAAPFHPYVGPDEISPPDPHLWREGFRGAVGQDWLVPVIAFEPGD